MREYEKLKKNLANQHTYDREQYTDAKTKFINDVLFKANQRLHQDRNQPELVNDDMDNWANFLKYQAIDKKAIFLDTSLMSKNEMIIWFKQHLKNLENE
jgi:hypothetical protein